MGLVNGLNINFIIFNKASWVETFAQPRRPYLQHGQFFTIPQIKYKLNIITLLYLCLLVETMSPNLETGLSGSGEPGESDTPI